MNNEQPQAHKGAPTDAPAPDVAILKAYTHAKQAIARQIRQIRQDLHRIEQDGLAAPFQELVVKLAEDRFTLAVMGQFKRGKSSLMSAIIGRGLLPTGVLPLTAAITVLRHGPQERLVVAREGSMLRDELPVARLVEFVTERGNPGTAKRVKTASIEVPLAFLRHGLEFVDTPGVGFAIEANTATAYQSLPQCDAVLFVTSVDSPLSRTEVDLLSSIRQHVRRIFLVVNKIDLVSSAELQDVLQFLADTLTGLPGHEGIELLPISARDGLSAKLNGNDDTYARSGLRNVEETLAAFLATAKASTFLTSVLDKAIAQLAQARVQLRGCEDGTFPWGDREGSLREPRAAVEVDLGQAMGPAAASEMPQGASAVAESAGLPPQMASRLQASSVAGLDLATRGCPLCSHLRESMLSYFSQWQYALASEEWAQSCFAAKGGLCPLHTWQLAAVPLPQGMSAGFALLCERLSLDLAAWLAVPGYRVELLPAAGHRCDACAFLGDAEETVVNQLGGRLGSAQGMDEYRASQGVCLRHLRMLVAQVRDDAVRTALVDLAARRFGEWSEDMQNYVMKHDAIRRGLLNEDGEDAHLRALVHLVGARELRAPWRLGADV